MADSNLNITVTTDVAGLQALIEKLNSGNITVAEYNKTIRALRAASIVGSQAQMDLKNVISQVSDQTLSANGQMMKSYFSLGEALRFQKADELTLTQTINAAREERRNYIFSVRESMQAISSVTNVNNVFMQSITQSTNTVLGAKFAIEAMGSGMAQFALPLALVIGLWTVLKSLFIDSKEDVAKHTEEIKKAREEYEKTGQDIKNLSDELSHLFPGDKRVVQITLQLKEDFKKQLDDINKRIDEEAAKNGTNLYLLGQETEYKKLLDERAAILQSMDDEKKKTYEQGELLKQIILLSKVATPAQMQTLLKTFSKNDIDAVTTALTTQRDAVAQTSSSWKLYNDALKLINPEKQKGDITDITREEEKQFQLLKLKQSAYPEETQQYISSLANLQRVTKDETVRLEIQKEINDTLKAQATANERNLDVLRRTTAETIKISNEAAQIQRQNKYGGFSLTPGRDATLENIESERNAEKQQANLKIKDRMTLDARLNAIDALYDAKAAQAKKQNETALNQSLLAGLDGMANAGLSKLNTMWDNVFGHGRSALQQFFIAFMGALDALIAKAAALFVFNLFTGGIGSLVSSGGSLLSGAGSYSGFPLASITGGSSASPSNIMHNTSQSISSKMNQMSGQGNSSSFGGRPYVTVVPIVSSKGLAVQVEVGNRLNARVRT